MTCGTQKKHCALDAPALKVVMRGLAKSRAKGADECASDISATRASLRMRSGFANVRSSRSLARSMRRLRSSTDTARLIIMSWLCKAKVSLLWTARFSVIVGRDDANILSFATAEIQSHIRIS